jgi:hypothetical protein
MNEWRPNHSPLRSVGRDSAERQKHSHSASLTTTWRSSACLPATASYVPPTLQRLSAAHSTARMTASPDFSMPATWIVPRAQLDRFPPAGSSHLVYALADRGARLLNRTRRHRICQRRVEPQKPPSRPSLYRTPVRDHGIFRQPPMRGARPRRHADHPSGRLRGHVITQRVRACVFHVVCHHRHAAGGIRNDINIVAVAHRVDGRHRQAHFRPEGGERDLSFGRSSLRPQQRAGLPRH